MSTSWAKGSARIAAALQVLRQVYNCHAYAPVLSRAEPILLSVTRADCCVEESARRTPLSALIAFSDPGLEDKP